MSDKTLRTVLVFSAAISLVSLSQARAGSIIPDLFVDPGQPEVVVLNELVTVETDFGSFNILLRADVAPITVGRFLTSVTAGDFSGTIFHRSDPGYAIHGGQFVIEDQEPKLLSGRHPVVEEGELASDRGTVAMVPSSDGKSHWRVLTAGDDQAPGASSQLITVFGKVIGGGMGAVDAINALPVMDLQFPFDQLPVAGDDISQPDYFAAVKSTTRISGVELVSQTAPDFVTASLEGRNLILSSVPGTAGTSDVTLLFSGPGQELVETFKVTAAKFDFFGRPPGTEAGASFWLGAFDDKNFDHGTSVGWIEHSEHGWLYVSGRNYLSGIWLWDHIQQEWLWTRKAIYPFFYSDERKNWLYYRRGGTPARRHVYDYRGAGAWKTVEE